MNASWNMSPNPAHSEQWSLPLEMCHDVLDFLWNDYLALKACSLVCRAWLATTRKHMFCSVTIHRNTYAQLEQLLDQSSYLTHFVRQLIVDVGYGRYIRAMTRVLLKLNNVKELTLQRWIAPDELPHEDLYSSEMASCFHNIEILHILASEVHPMNSCRLLCACSRLTSLHVQHLLFPKCSVILPDGSVPEQLLAVRTRCPTGLQFLHFDHSPPLLLAWLLHKRTCEFKQLRLSWTSLSSNYDGFMAVWLQRLLRAAGSNLRHLWLSPVCGLGDDPQDISLADNDSLEILHLDVALITLDWRVQWIADVLTDVHSSLLRRVEIGFRIYINDHKQCRYLLNWESLDWSLARLASSMSDLEIVFLVLDPTEMLVAAIYESLPSIRKERCRLGVVQDARFVATVMGQDKDRAASGQKAKWFSF